MTVRELYEKLAILDPTAIVCFQDDDKFAWAIDSVTPGWAHNTDDGGKTFTTLPVVKLENKGEE